MSDTIQYEQRVSTKDIVAFLMGCRDQVASTRNIAEKFDVTESCACVRDALDKLQKVNRVEEFSTNLWHLE